MARESVQAQLAALLAGPIAHRGLHACGAPGPVENSVGAAKAAIARGHGIECDVQLSADGEAIVFHDETLERLTAQSGRLCDLDAEALSRVVLRGGSDRIPTLAMFLAAIDGRVPLVIEIKSRGTGDMRLTERTLQLLSTYAGAAAIESFDPAVVLRCRHLRTDRPIGLVGPAEDGALVDDGARAACDFLSWSMEAVAEIAARHPDLPRSTWTVRTPEQVRRAESCGAQIVFEGFDPHR